MSIQEFATDVLNKLAEVEQYVTKTYLYEVKHKDGTIGQKTIVRKYKTNKDSSPTLQNKNNKDTLIQAINEHYDEIMNLPKHKRINYIQTKLMNEGTRASYNTLKKLLNAVASTRSLNAAELQHDIIAASNVDNAAPLVRSLNDEE